ncbi:MAG: hypothetical protein AAF191_09080 [Verrucomicrobiota bacterium]
MRTVLAILFLLLSLCTAGIAYNALALVHYDLDPVSVLASLLSLRIPTLGYVSIAVSFLSASIALVVWRSRRS